MPCNTIVTNTVEIGKVAQGHPDLLERALRGEFTEVTVRGSTFYFNADGRRVALTSGKASSTMDEMALQKVVGRINQSVAREAVRMAARRFGWATVAGADANHFSIRKG